MAQLSASFGPMMVTLQEGRQALREKLQQMDERKVIDWAALDALQGSASELGDQAEVLLAVMTAQGADEDELMAAQALVLFFTHSSVHMMMRLAAP